MMVLLTMEKLHVFFFGGGVVYAGLVSLTSTYTSPYSSENKEKDKEKVSD